MGGHDAHEPYAVPHPSVYKVETVPQLKEVQAALARQSLKDPWLRNEAWRYEPRMFGTHGSRARAFFLRGLLWGAGLAAITIGVETVFKKGDDGHGHGHENGNGNGHGAEEGEGEGEKH